MKKISSNIWDTIKKYPEVKSRKDEETRTALRTKLENSKFFNHFFPKYDELDAYILLVLIIVSLIFSNVFREYFSESLLFLIIVIILLLVGTKYAFNFKKTMSQWLGGFVSGGIALIVAIFGIEASRYLLGSNLSQGINFFVVVSIFFALINFIRSLVTLILVRVLVITEKLFYVNNNTKILHILMATLTVLILWFLQSQIIINKETLAIVFSNIFAITSLIAHFNWSNKMEKQNEN